MEPTPIQFRDSSQGPPEVYPDAPPTLQAVIMKWVLRASVAGIALSIVIHTLFLVGAYFIRFGDGRTPGTGKGGEEVGLAVMTEGEFAEIQDAAPGTDTPTIPAEVSVSVTDLGGLDVSAETDATGGSSELGGIGTVSGGGDVGGEGGVGLGGSGGSGGTSFFGIEARGSRFAYIVDVSGSMGDGSDNGGRIAELREQLTKSINALAENFSFMVAAFSSDVTPLGNRRAWTFADDKGKRWARGEIYGLRPQGGTNPGTAFKLVFDLKPRPDAIYFLTDGEIPENEGEMILLLNREYRVPVHCICFESAEGESLLKRIARESGGTYTYIAGASQRGRP